MNAVDHFVISYLVPDILTCKESQHHATTKTAATVKIVMSSGLHVDQQLRRLTTTQQILTRTN